MKLNVASIKTRLQKLERYIGELRKQQARSLEEFEQDSTAQLAVERAFQAATECCIDIGSHLVSVYGLGKRVIAAEGNSGPSTFLGESRSLMLGHELGHGPQFADAGLSWVCSAHVSAPFHAAMC